MKKIALFCLLVLFAQAGWMDTLKEAAQSYTKSSKQTQQSPQERSAIKQALEIGVKKAIAALGKKDGFYKNPLVKIPLPSQIKTVASTLKKVGMGKYVDQFELSMNRAAEEAVPQTASIFIQTIKNMKVEDAKKLVFSKKPDAATEYFKEHAGKQLAQKIAPIVKKHMESEQVTKYYRMMMEYYNKYGAKYANNSYAKAALGALGMGAPQKVEEKDLSSYVTNKTLQGLYTMIAQQEKAIRTNPAARVTPLLQKVFGGK